MLREWRYRLEKGRPHLILLISLLLLILAISLLGGLLVYAAGIGDSVGTSIWWTFLHLSDPGYLGDDDSPVKALFGTIFTLLGMLIFVAGLIGILTSLITSRLIGLREGGAPIAFRDHIVIVGWNTRIFTLLSDLLHASTSYQIAILGSPAKSDAENQLEKRVFSRIELEEGDRAARRAKGHVVYRQGTPAVDHDLRRVAAAHATRFILLAQETGMSATATDVSQIRNLYSIERSHLGTQRRPGRFNTVVELASDHLRSHAFYSLKIDPRLDTWVAYYEEQLEKRGERSYLPTPGKMASNHDMTAVNTGQLVSRVIVQCAVQPFLSGVYEELFSFQGREIFLWRPDHRWQAVWTDMLALPNAERPGFLAEYTRNGIVIGRLDRQSVSFDPAHWIELGADHPYVVLGDKQLWTGRPGLPRKRAESGADCELQSWVPPATYRVLVLGLNYRFPLLVEQFRDYAEQYPGMRLSIDVVDPQETVPLAELPPALEVQAQCADYTDWAVLGQLLETQASYDTIVLLSEDRDIDDPEVDARVTLALVMLRAFRDDDSWRRRLEDVNIVAEVRDPRNRNILRQEDLAGDVIVGDEYVSGFIAQVCIDHHLEEIYREVLDYGRYEIYARRLPASQETVYFADLVDAGARRGETAIGFLKRVGANQMVPVLAPAQDAELGAGDLPLVIASN